jgi:hypothetical protein
MKDAKVTFTAAATGTFDSYEWYHNGKLVNGASTAEYAPADIGLLDSVRCVVRSSDSCAFVASSPVVLIHTFHGFKLYPNPSNGDFTISGNDEDANNTEVQISVYSEDGRRVYERINAFHKIAFFETMQLRELLAPGVYIVSVVYGGRQEKMLLSVVP